ncbi:hypothetical protein ACFVGY_08430 [Streptomyces sp. NPDC127106]|uniref:hypothetical protein n=1 Tax=Streptomyces sp. NPDC127106 TaxID=3345360 RepID=UPI00362C68B9
MSADAVAGPALFIGDDTAYVALVRPQLDPSDPDVVRAAGEAGVSPEEFAGPGDVWALLVEDGAEGDGFELPGLRDVEADGFAEQLQAAVAAAEPFTVEAGAVLRLDGTPAGDGWALTAHVTPPEGHDTPARTLTAGPVVTADLLADLAAFRGSLA